MTQLVKVCKTCGKNCTANELVKCKQTSDGYRPLCKICKSKEQAEYRRLTKSLRAKEARIRAKELAEAQAREDAEKALPFIARPRTFVRYGVWDGQIAVEYKRNDGHKHIPSIGVRC